MPYKRKQIIEKISTESWQEYAKRLVNEYPAGYMNYIQKQIPELLAQFVGLPYPRLGERFYNWLNPHITTPSCLQCPNPVLFESLSAGGYREFCSVSCRAIYKKSNLNGLTEQAVQKRANWRKNLSDNDKQQMVKKGLHTAIKRYGVPSGVLANRKAQQMFADNRPSQLNNPAFLQDEHFINKKSIQQMSNENGVSWALVKGAISRFDITRQYNSIERSVSEKQIADFLESHNITIERNNRTLLKPQEIDIVIPDHNLAIEFCGLYWHSDANLHMSASYHNQKRIQCGKLGLQLITIFEDEWINQPDIVKSRLLHLCKKSANVHYARQCTLVELSSSEAGQFFDLTHIQGNKAASVKYGLKFGNVLIAAASFSKPRYDKEADWEVIRMSTSLNTSVVGGLSKLVKYFVKVYSPKNLISYSDNRWGSGGGYQQNGFDFVAATQPSYWYFKTGSLNRHHRSQFMKHKIVALGGDSNMTEIENMHIMGYHRIYDCGTTKWKHTT